MLHLDHVSSSSLVVANAPRSEEVYIDKILWNTGTETRIRSLAFVPNFPRDVGVKIADGQ